MAKEKTADSVIEKLTDLCRIFDDCVKIFEERKSSGQLEQCSAIHKDMMNIREDVRGILKTEGLLDKEQMILYLNLLFEMDDVLLKETAK